MHYYYSDKYAIQSEVWHITEHSSILQIFWIPHFLHLGYFNQIFRLSQLHQCDQGMLPNRFLKVHWGTVSLVTLASIFFQKIYLVTSQAFLPQPCNQGTQGQICKIKETTNLTRNVDFLKGDTNLTKEGSFSTTLCWNCKHSLNLMCHTPTKGIQLR